MVFEFNLDLPVFVQLSKTHPEDKSLFGDILTFFFLLLFPLI